MYRITYFDPVGHLGNVIFKRRDFAISCYRKLRQMHLRTFILNQGR